MQSLLSSVVVYEFSSAYKSSYYHRHHLHKCSNDGYLNLTDDVQIETSVRRRSLQHAVSCASMTANLVPRPDITAHVWTATSWPRTGVAASWRQRAGRRGSTPAH